MDFGIACSACVAEATTLLADVDGGGAETAGAVLDARVSASTTTAVDSCAGSSLFSSQCRSSSKAVMSAPLVSAKPLCGRNNSRMAATLAATTRSARPSQTASFQLATHACCGSDRMSVLGTFACAPRSRRSSTTAGLDSATPLAQPRHALYSRVRFRSSFRSKSSSLVFRMDNTSSKRASKTAAKSDLCTRSRSRTRAGRFDRVGKIDAERTPKWPSSAQLQRFNPFGQHIAAQASEYYADGGRGLAEAWMFSAPSFSTSS
jgi:hypothetical protein